MCPMMTGLGCRMVALAVGAPSDHIWIVKVTLPTAPWPNPGKTGNPIWQLPCLPEDVEAVIGVYERRPSKQT